MGAHARPQRCGGRRSPRSQAAACPNADVTRSRSFDPSNDIEGWSVCSGRSRGKSMGSMNAARHKRDKGRLVVASYRWAGI
jgi:hypothetical protein